MKELQSINDRIAERVGHELVDLIPEDQWQKMIDAQINRFKTDVFPRVVEEELTKYTRDKVAAAIDELLMPEWDSIAQANIYPRLREFMGQGGGEVFAAVLSPAMQQILQQLRHQMMQY